MSSSVITKNTQRKIKFCWSMLCYHQQHLLYVRLLNPDKRFGVQLPCIRGMVLSRCSRGRGGNPGAKGTGEVYRKAKKEPGDPQGCRKLRNREKITQRNISQIVKGQRHIAGSGKFGHPPPPPVSHTCWEFFDKLSGF